MSTLNRSFVLSRILAQLTREPDILALPGLELDGDEVLRPDISIFPVEKVTPNFFEDVERLRQMPLIAVEIIDGRKGSAELLERARKLMRQGVKACWLVEPLARSVIVLDEGKRRLVHAEWMESQGVSLDFSAVFAEQGKVEGSSASKESGDDRSRRLVDALRKRHGERRIFLPSTGAEDWRHLLAEPERDWRQGSSVRALAYCWEEHDGLPPEIGVALKAEPALGETMSMFVVPEFPVALPGGARPAVNDIWLLARTRSGLASITVEGSNGESFGRSVEDWFDRDSQGKTSRLRFLCEQLELDFPPPQNLRYSLLQRVASAIIEARRLALPVAMTLVHAFSDGQARRGEKNGKEEFELLAQLLGATGRVEHLARKELSGGLQLYLGWVSGDQRYLQS